MNQKGNIQYPYAIDETGTLIHIGSIDKELRHEHSYKCPYCSQRMSPRLGKKYTHCFAHSENQSCSEESYLHATGKKILKDAFDRSETFIINFTRRYICRNHKTCKDFTDGQCCCNNKESYDLKEYYDLPAEIEYRIEGNPSYRADVALLSSNPKRKPIALEVWCTHKASENKRRDNTLIEFRVKSFKELESLNTNYIKEGAEILFHGFKDKLVSPDEIEQKTRIYNKVSKQGFVRFLPVCKQPQYYKNANLPLVRATVLKDGTVLVGKISFDQINVHHEDAIADLTYDSSTINFDFEPRKYLVKQFKVVRRCNMCMHCFMYSIPNYCNITGSKEVINNGEMAISCPHFSPTSYLLEYRGFQAEEGKDYVIWTREQENP